MAVKKSPMVKSDSKLTHNSLHDSNQQGGHLHPEASIDTTERDFFLLGKDQTEEKWSA